MRFHFALFGTFLHFSLPYPPLQPLFPLFFVSGIENCSDDFNHVAVLRTCEALGVMRVWLVETAGSNPTPAYPYPHFNSDPSPNPDPDPNSN